MKEKVSVVKTALLGLFVVVGIAAGAFGIFSIGQNERVFGENFKLSAEFSFIAGIQEGSLVRVQGLEAGVVEEIAIPQSPGEKIIITMRIDNKFQPLIRKDASATLMTQGIVGSKVVEINPGSAGASSVDSGDTISAEAPIELTQIFQEAFETSQEIREIGQQLSAVMERVENMTARVEAGEGSLGKFVMKDDAHEAALQLLSSGDRLMSHTDESLIAMRRTWPFKDYLSAAGVNDATDLLFRPNSVKETKTIDSQDLFLKDKSLLTESGRSRLNKIGDWLNTVKHGDSEIVIASYQPTTSDEDLAKKLSHERATAVREYLVAHHGITKLGWFARREVTAAGFGKQSLAEPPKIDTTDRIEITVFIPQDLSP